MNRKTGVRLANSYRALLRLLASLCSTMFRAVISEGLALRVALALSRHSIGHVGVRYTVLRRPRAVFVFACKLLPLSKVTSMVHGRTLPSPIIVRALSHPRTM